MVVRQIHYVQQYAVMTRKWHSSGSEPLKWVLLGCLAFQTCVAAEIDSVTPRKLRLENSVDYINEIINQRIEEGVREANAVRDYLGYLDDIDDVANTGDGEDNNYCDEDVLYSELRKAIFQSFTASWGLKGYDLDKQLRGLLAEQSYSLLLNDSIYRDIDYIEGFSLNLKELSDVVNVNGYLVGLDKIGHFFAEGWQYFEMTHYQEKTLDEAIEWGRQKEAGLYGYTTTGIFSYADLVANLNGWRFWNKVLLRQDDPLKGVFANLVNRPYIACEIQFIDSIKNRRVIRAWEFNKRFDISDYIDGAWDEGDNCNSYADPIIEDKVAARIKKVAPDFDCPVSADHCRDAQVKYGDYSKYVLHPYCLIAGQD